MSLKQTSALLRRRQLDKQLNPLQPFTRTSRPRKGWLTGVVMPRHAVKGTLYAHLLGTGDKGGKKAAAFFSPLCSCLFLLNLFPRRL